MPFSMSLDVSIMSSLVIFLSMAFLSLSVPASGAIDISYAFERLHDLCTLFACPEEVIENQLLDAEDICYIRIVRREGPIRPILSVKSLIYVPFSISGDFLRGGLKI